MDCCQSQDRNRDRSAAHIDRGTKRNGYGVCVTIQSQFFAEFHINRYIRCGTSRKESRDPAVFQAFKDEGIRISSDSNECDQWIDHKCNERHASHQKQDQSAVAQKRRKPLLGYCGKYKSKHAERRTADNPLYDL